MVRENMKNAYAFMKQVKLATDNDETPIEWTSDDIPDPSSSSVSIS